MKTFLKHLLVLALMVLVFSGCQNPSGPETPEDLTKVEFRWGEYYQVAGHTSTDGQFYSYISRYFLGLRSKSLDDCDYDCDYVYDYPEGYDSVSWQEIRKDEERLKEFYEDAFEKVFGTKYYKEGTTIDLKKWTSEAVDLVQSDEDEGVITTVRLYFLDEDVGLNSCYLSAEDSFNEVVVGSEDIVVYVYWDMYF